MRNPRAIDAAKTVNRRQLLQVGGLAGLELACARSANRSPVSECFAGMSTMHGGVVIAYSTTRAPEKCGCAAWS